MTDAKPVTNKRWGQAMSVCNRKPDDGGGKGWLGKVMVFVGVATMSATLANCAVSRSRWLDMAGEWTPRSGICAGLQYRFTPVADGGLRFEYWDPSKAAFVESEFRGPFRAVDQDRVEFDWGRGNGTKGTDKFQLAGNELRYWVEARSWSDAPSCVFVRSQLP